MNYHDIKKCDMLNGDGIRVSLWVSGCEHNCNQCQNPQTWSVNSGTVFGKEDEEELFEALNKDWISGITFSGGDPLHENNLEDVLNLVNKIRLSSPDKTIWVYTGYVWETIINDNKRREIVLNCDVLIDGQYIHEQRDTTLKWRGSTNQRIIDIRKSIQEDKLVLLI